MTEPYIGEIQIFGFNFNPRNWAFCNGAALSIQQNTALFALLGTQYGGNGQTTFQLPNFAGRAGCQQGQGPVLTPRSLGQNFGTNTVTLTSTQIPAHSHGFNSFSQSDSTKKSGSPSNGAALSLLTVGVPRPYIAAPLNTTFPPNMIQPSAGGGQPHQNQQPYLGLNFCIALQGTFPSFP